VIKPRVQFRLRISRGTDIAIGPGKIDLLEAIEAAGSISADHGKRARLCRLARPATTPGVPTAVCPRFARWSSKRV
jgi:hypothetical protein